MTATLQPTPAPAPAPIRKPGFGHALASEWTKIRTVKSTVWTLLAAVIVTVGFSVLIAWATVANWNKATASEKASFDSVSNSLAGVYMGLLALGVLGAMAITAEYSTGMIRTSLTALPNRPVFLTAKALILVVVAFVAGVVAAFGAYLLSQMVYGTKHLNVALGDDGVLRSVIGGGLYLTIVALFALGIGTILRHTAGSITVVVALLFVLPMFSPLLPGDWGRTIRKLLPSNAGGAIMSPHRQSDMLAPWTGFAVFCLYTAIVLVAAFALFQKRDA
jgi:ABC-2 type transport system permease protein